MSNLLKRALAYGLTGAADAWSDNLGYQGGHTQALRQRMQQAEEEAKLKQEQEAMMRALQGATRHMMAGDEAGRQSAITSLMNNPDTAPMAFNLASQRLKPVKPMVLKEGEAAFDPSGKQLFNNPAAAKPEKRVMVYNIQTGRGYALVEGSDEYIKALDSRRYTLDKPDKSGGNRTVQLYNPTTNEYKWATPDEANDFARQGFVPASERARGGPKQYTQDQYNAAGYAQRMAAAEDIINRLERGGFNPSSYLESARGMTNLTSSPEYAQYQQAMRDWVRAKLRKESGATIGDDEMATEIKTYFGEPGMSSANKQKAKARNRALEAMAFSSGGAFSDLMRAFPTEQEQKREYVGFSESGRRLYKDADGQLYEE